MNQNLRKYFIIFIFPVLYALVLRGLFGLTDVAAIFSVMTLSFLFFGPLVMGILTTYFSPDEDKKKFSFKFFVPWIPIFIFFGSTILFQIEGWACWIMVMPLFLIASSIGGFIGANISRNKSKNTYVTLALFIPILLSPIEKSIKTSAKTFRAYTYIDIESTPEKIWNQVTRVSEIAEQDDSGWFTNALGFPRPLSAELNYEGVGAYRKAIFTNGLQFHETVTTYDHQKKMTFTIQANPHEIPSTTLDEHIVVGGTYFDVLNGTYELEKLSSGKYRLHLYSHFILNTTFNNYAGIWATWIMKDIQNNILKIEKKRAEQS